MYLYGIFSFDAQLPKRARGVDGRQLSLHRVGDVVALVHLEPVAQHADEAALASRLEAHQAALAAVQASAGLPLRMLTEVSPEALERMLRLQSETLLGWLRRFSQCWQVNVVGRWMLPEALAAVAARPAVVAARAALPAQPQESDIVAVGQQLELELAKQRQRMLESCRARLGRAAIAGIEVARQGEDEVLRMSLLVSAPQLEALGELLIEPLEEKITVRFQRSQAGIPYAFATLALQEIQPCDLERACGILALQAVTEPETLTRAFRTAMRRSHPDQLGSGPAPFTVTEIVWARDVMLAHQQGISFQLAANG